MGLRLLTADGSAEERRWSLSVAVQVKWRLPFAILFGQRGWFDVFPTTIDARSSLVHVDGV